MPSSFVAKPPPSPNVPTAESYFPWRAHAPREKRVKDYVTNWVARAIVADWLFSFQSDKHPSASYMEIDFLLGCQQAFRATCAAIFKHKNLSVVKLEATDADTADTAAFVPALSAVLETHLAHFYESAVATMGQSKFQIYYELGSVDDPTVETYDVVFGGKRGADFGGLVRRDTFGIIGTIGTEKGQTSAEKHAFFSDLTNLEHLPQEVSSGI